MISTNNRKLALSVHPDPTSVDQLTVETLIELIDIEVGKQKAIKKK